MIRRNKRYTGVTARTSNPVYPKSQTTQDEPSLRDILIRYQRGENISDYVHEPAQKATAEQQFKNKFAKVDPLTEIETYVKQETRKANDMVELEKRKKTQKKATENTPQQPVETPSENFEK